MDELILVDLDDNEIGHMSKPEAHRLGTLHRAFSVFIINDKNEMLIQKRNENKYHSGGLWTNACCSHPRLGENLLDAVHRRLVEEIGFDTEVAEQFGFVYRTQFDKELFEYEYDHVFLGKYDGEITLNKEEASEIKWIDIEALKKDLVENANDYTSWFLIAAPRLLAHK